MTKEDYAKRAHQWAKALKLLDPSIKLILCGETGHTSWDHYVLKHCIKFIDMHSIHMYTSGNIHMKNVTAPLAAERSIQITSGLIDLARIEAGIPASVPKQTICFDEWNVWDPLRAPGEEGAEELYTLSDALAVGVWLNVFVRQSKHLGMCNIAQSVNVISPLMTTKSGIVKQATWWPYYLFCKYMRGWTLGVHVRAESYVGETQPKWLENVLGDDGAALLDVSAVVDEDGVVSMCVVNIHEDRDFVVQLSGVVGTVTAYWVTADSLSAVNREGSQEVALKECEFEWDTKGYKFGKSSLTLLRWKTGAKVRAIVNRTKATAVKVGFSATIATA